MAAPCSDTTYLLAPGQEDRSPNPGLSRQTEENHKHLFFSCPSIIAPKRSNALAITKLS